MGGDTPAAGPPEEQGPGATSTALRPERHAPKHRAPKRVEEEDDRGGILGFFRELPGLVLVAFVLALLIKTFLIQAFFIPSASMVPTLRIGDRVLVNKLVYDFGEPQRGDVIVFEDPNAPAGPAQDRNLLESFLDWLTEGLGFSAGQEQDFIKRVVGLPGDTISMDDGTVFIDGEPLDEPYLVRPGNDSFNDVVVEEGRLFVMGDNRENSSDSRIFGQIPDEKVIGKAFVLLWPPSRLEFLSDD